MYLENSMVESRAAEFQQDITLMELLCSINYENKI
jgi:hypothetical protein